ncbi:TrkA C-terminal domain-containing protein [Halorientalis sp.]|uniref:TrkA C-terminal domain-containing protein n=1 Tax=Halorientalis sp. TaxID=1931229 RepID=UPI0026273D81|nr:TrkA C-terminal domain-containing protein [Halorientalis sp.]
MRVISFTPSLRRKAILAEKAILSVSVEDPTDEIIIHEVLIRRHSPLHGVRVTDCPVVTNPDSTLVAGWFDGVFHLPPNPDDRITPNTVLMIAGPEHAVDEAASQAAGARATRPGGQSNVVVAGSDEAVAEFERIVDVTRPSGRRRTCYRSGL